MVSQLELVKKFCSTYDIKYFFMLNKKTQKFFKEAAYYLLKLNPTIDYDKPLYEGIATIIMNATRPTFYKPFGKIYSLIDVEVVESEKYDMKLLLLGDSHTYNHGCTKKSDDVISFIDAQVRTSTCFVDLYLEIPYIWEKEGRSVRVINTWMAHLHDKYWDCFTWTKHCHIGNLRAHYVDLRNFPNDNFIKTKQIIIALYYKHPITHYSKEIKDVLNDNISKKIFKNQDTVINHIVSIVKKTKINKQIENIEDPKVKKAVKKYIKFWYKEVGAYVDLDIISWSNIEKILKGKAPRRLVEKMYFVIAMLPASLMDLYTIARMFRKFDDKPGKYSLPARNIIVFAGSFHTHRYRNFLIHELGFKLTFQQLAKTQDWTPGKGQKKAGNLCVDVSKLDQPVFRSKKAVKTVSK